MGDIPCRTQVAEQHQHRFAIQHAVLLPAGSSCKELNAEGTYLCAKKHMSRLHFSPRLHSVVLYLCAPNGQLRQFSSKGRSAAAVLQHDRLLLFA